MTECQAQELQDLLPDYVTESLSDAARAGAYASVDVFGVRW